jgi:hypothetical protein
MVANFSRSLAYITIVSANPRSLEANIMLDGAVGAVMYNLLIRRFTSEHITLNIPGTRLLQLDWLVVCVVPHGHLLPGSVVDLSGMSNGAIMCRR